MAGSEQLVSFFSAYFHEDWDLEAGGPDDVVEMFVREGRGEEELAALGREVSLFAARFDEDVELERVLFRELGCYYAPSGAGVSAKAWLNAVATRLLEAAGGRR